MRAAKTVAAPERLHMSLLSQGPENNKEQWQCRTVTHHNPSGTRRAENFPWWYYRSWLGDARRLHGRTAPQFPLLWQTRLLPIAMCNRHLHSLRRCPCPGGEFELWRPMPNQQLQDRHQSRRPCRSLGLLLLPPFPSFPCSRGGA